MRSTMYAPGMNPSRMHTATMLRVDVYAINGPSVC